MDRRHFLKQATTGFPLLFISPSALSQPETPAFSKRKKILILIELRGGNDGLNTLAPYSQSNYYKFRPTLSIPKDKLIPISQKSGLGLHPGLKNLSQMIRNKEVAVLQGVGYPDPSLSHFRSMDIWSTANPKDDLSSEGWLKPLIVYKNQQALSFSDELGGFEGSPKNVFVIEDKKFKNKKKGKRIQKIDWTSSKRNKDNQALAHILNVKSQISKLETVLKSNKANNFDITASSSFQRQIKTLLQVISNNHPVSLFKIHLQGFDTHKNQFKQHNKLLKDLDRGMFFLTKYLKELNAWNQTLILTYSEFGRRVKENKSQGTDHGTASVHFAVGGLVKPGFYGHEPVLKTANNLSYHLDFRSLYAAILKEQFGLSETNSQLVKNFYKANNSFLNSS